MVKLYMKLVDYITNESRIRFSFKAVLSTYTFIAFLTLACMLVTQNDLCIMVAAMNALMHLATYVIADSNPTASVKYNCVLIWNIVFYTMLIFLVGYDSGYSLFLLTIAPIATSIQYTQKHTHEKKLVQPWVYAVFCTAIIMTVYSLLNVNLGLMHPLISVSPITTFNIFKVNITIVSIMQVCILMVLRMSASHYEESTKQTASLDALTGLRNRQNLFNEISKNNHQLYSGAIIDVDDFKKFNDTYGHNNGDLVLKEVASQLLDIEARNPGILSCRWGGEEFVLIGTTPDSFFTLKRELELMVLSRGHTPFAIADTEEYVTITGGLTKYQPKDSIESLVSRADAFLYLGKNRGKCRIISEE